MTDKELNTGEPVAWIKQGKYGKPTIVQNPLYQFSYQAESVKQPDISLYSQDYVNQLLGGGGGRLNLVETYS